MEIKADSPPETLPSLDSTEAIKFVWVCWRILGMHPFERHRCLYWLYSFVVNLSCSVLCPLHLLANLFFRSDFEGIMANLSVSISALFSTIKQFIIFYHSRRNLWHIREHLKLLEKRAAAHSDEHRIVTQAVRFCRRMFIGVAFAYSSGLYMYSISGLIRRQLTFDGWMPFDYSTSTSLYGLAFVVQLLDMNVLLFQELANDTYGISYLALLVAHVRALNVRIARIGNDRSRSVEQNSKELVQCVFDYRACMRFYELLSPVLSATMFAQFLITGVVLCIIFVGILVSDETLAQQASYLFYIVCLTIEILPCCWYVDELNVQLKNVTTSLYQCRWYEQDQSFRRTLIIFMQRTQKVNTITAGSLAPVTLSTVRAILQFAFSMFTVINRMKLSE